MNRKEYNGDPRYAKVLEKMDLLGIMDVTTTRQDKNGTIVWKLPIKNNNSGKTLIEVASMSTGYVRNQNSGYSNYQLNKRCDSEPDYYKIERNGETLYRKYTTRTCKLIPIEIERLEYLISYCLKNYYIKNANQVAEGSYVSKWYHEYELERNQNKMEDICHLDANCKDNLEDAVCTIIKHEETIEKLQNKLQSIIRTARH